MKALLSLSIWMFVNVLFCQDPVVIVASIADSNTGLPIEYVNIGFDGKGIGTVSSEEGRFELRVKKDFASREYELFFSCVGYETKRLSYSQWRKLEGPDQQIFLDPQTTELEPVVIFSGKRGYDKLGSETYSLSELGYWTDRDALGGELATRIRIDRERTRLHNFRFHVIRNEADSVRVRVNIYDCSKNMPGKNLLSESIYHTISKSKGVETIPLKDHNIVVNDDIVVGIEMVESYGDDLYLSISATPFGGTAYLRERSMAGWDVRWNFGLAFGFLASYPVVATNP